jgi:hypothetical protein
MEVKQLFRQELVLPFSWIFVSRLLTKPSQTEG